MTDRWTKLSVCRGCGAGIVWLTTKTGKAMPVNSASVLPTDTTFDRARHVSHFATCPAANRFRKARGRNYAHGG